MKLVYHPRYDLNLGEHVFPSQKYRLVRERLLAEGAASLDDFLEPEPITDRQALLVHDPGWVQRLKAGTLSYAEGHGWKFHGRAKLSRPFGSPPEARCWQRGLRFKKDEASTSAAASIMLFQRMERVSAPSTTLPSRFACCKRSAPS